MDRIPFDIVINHIIPYTYTIQPKLLLEDVANYYNIKCELMDTKHDTELIKHEILAIFYTNKPRLNDILSRHFQIKLKKYDDSIIYRYSRNVRFNILFGLFTKNERTHFSEYILKELREWILK